MTKEEAYKKLEELIKKFEEYYDSYHKQDYNETLTRRDFIDPFFKILNWDIDNEQALAQSYREVIHEDKVKVGKETKAPDYSFRIGGKIVFYVEAKKPSVELKDNIEPAYQVRRYGWSAKLPISLLTDFEEFAIYDCTKKPNQNDKASTARIKYINYKEYLKEFDFLWDLFNKDNIPRGSLEKYTSNLKDKKGTEEVGDEFLASLDNYREKLASNISKLNTDFTSRDINFTVQQIVDRIIFLRIAEDRGVENYGGLRNALNGENYYQNMFNIFLQADGKYNSGLFDFSKDTTSKKTIIDNKIIKEIVNDLYYPKSPYEFSVLPVEILGSAYEQFLGKTITITDNHKAKIEYKPEVRKAGGIYYTPEYIVDYIVENTVGEMVKNKTPKEIEKIKIVDPACGSGSFLLGAYKYLLSYHKKYYNEKKLKGRGTKEDVLTPTGELATRVKKQILINNIYGVDIDVNAVEVTKLSLLLKCLEGETPESLQNEKSLFNERALPSLEDNIKCGNSLIGSDFYSQGNLELDEETIYKINCFDWEKAFPSVFRNGGFDCVIGNPPYVKEYTDRETFENIKKSYLAKYYQGKMDLWYFFVCYGLDILKDNGLLGFIAPNNWITNAGASILRNKVLSDAKIIRYIDFGDYRVFADAGIQTMVFVLSKEKKESYKLDFFKILNKNIELVNLVNLLQRKELNEDIKKITISISKEKMKDQLITFVDNSLNTILDKIKSVANYYFNEKEITNGIHHHHDYVDKNRNEILGNIFTIGDGIFILSKREKEELNFTEKELELIKPVYTTEQLGRYYANSKNKEWVIYTDSKFKDSKNIKPYPNIKKHLDKFKKVITSDNAPYGLHRTRKEAFFKGEKIISLRKCSKYPVFSYVDFDSYVSATFYVIKPSDINLKYLTAILNSKLIAFWLKHKGKMQGSNYQIDKEPLLNIPINNTEDKAKHDKLATLVDKMLELNKKITTVNSPHEKEIIKRQIEAFDSEIDKLVYSLYNLTDNEIKVVEGN